MSKLPAQNATANENNTGWIDRRPWTPIHADEGESANAQRSSRIEAAAVYSRAAKSAVRVSVDAPEYTTDVTATGSVLLLEVIREVGIKPRFYQASSSEMFGKVQEVPQTETTPFYPRSPYGCAKVYSFWVTVNYRESYGMHASNGILFNHESPRRGSNFVTNKVVKCAVQIKKGLRDKLPLGNLDSYRDWGHSKDYVRAMHMILNHTEPDDFVCATGISRSVGDMCEYVFNQLDLDYKDYVTQDERFMRAEELKYLKIGRAHV